MDDKEFSFREVAQAIVMFITIILIGVLLGMAITYDSPKETENQAILRLQCAEVKPVMVWECDNQVTKYKKIDVDFAPTANQWQVCDPGDDDQCLLQLSPPDFSRAVIAR